MAVIIAFASIKCILLLMTSPVVKVSLLTAAANNWILPEAVLQLKISLVPPTYGRLLTSLLVFIFAAITIKEKKKKEVGPPQA